MSLSGTCTAGTPSFNDPSNSSAHKTQPSTFLYLFWNLVIPNFELMRLRFYLFHTQNREPSKSNKKSDNLVSHPYSIKTICLLNLLHKYRLARRALFIMRIVAKSLVRNNEFFDTFYVLSKIRLEIGTFSRDTQLKFSPGNSLEITINDLFKGPPEVLTKIM